MQLVFDPVTALNLLLCIIIVAICSISYLRLRSTTPLFIGAAFFLFGISHAATLAGYRTDFEEQLLIVRGLGYISVCIGIALVLQEIIQRKHTEEELRAERTGLEHHVKERTAQLNASNQKLIASEALLRESEAKYRTLVDRAQEAIIIVQDGRFIFANRRMGEILGIPEGDLIGREFSEFIWPEDRELVMRNYQKRIAGEDATAAYDFRIVGVGGENRWVFLSVALIMWNGRPATLSLVTDITRRKASEQALRESEEKYRTLAENAPVGILICNKTGQITFVNTRMLEMLGSPGKEQTLQINLLTYPPLVTLGLSGILDRCLKTRTPAADIGMEYESHWGKKVFYRGHIVPFSLDKPDGGALLILDDLTERRRTESALELANAKLNLLSGITRHDINNQLLALRSYLALAKDLAADAKQVALLERADNAADAISWQIDFTKNYQEIGAQAPKWQEVSTIIDDAVHQLRPPEVAITNATGGYEIFADPLIGKVFYNLMENSLRHGVRVSQMAFSAEVRADRLVIRYADNGVGIAADDKPHIFEKGFGRHTGLGLFLSEEILSITGITITENGEPGRGVLFDITVPAGSFRASPAGNEGSKP
ncbi:MAG: PAS domain S-box protein [Methanomicrobiales archaeon]|nr:PAS domain S-box protein [Methanomicrobiales archaeon]